jgi:hypothetical protein
VPTTAPMVARRVSAETTRVPWPPLPILHKS